MLQHPNAQWLDVKAIEILRNDSSKEQFALEATNASSGARTFELIHGCSGQADVRLPLQLKQFLRAFDSMRPCIPGLLRDIGREDLAVRAEACRFDPRLSIESVMLPGCAMQLYSELQQVGEGGIYPIYKVVVHQDLGAQTDEWDAVVPHLAIQKAYEESRPLLSAAAVAELEFTLRTPIKRKASDLFEQIYADLERRDMASGSSRSKKKRKGLGL